VRSSIYPSSRHGTGHHHRHVRLKTKSMSVRCMGGSQRLKSSRRVQVSKVRNVQSIRTSKRRRLRWLSLNLNLVLLPWIYHY
jgi:hypothetical protein